MSTVSDQAVRIIAGELHGTTGIPGAPRRSAERIVERLERAGLLARCTCPVGFGQVRDPGCPQHGDRTPAHTITGAPA